MNTIQQAFKDYLYNHIEWEHIELEAKTDNLDLLSLERLTELAIKYGF